MSFDVAATLATFGGKRLTPEEAQTILPILEHMRQGALDRNDWLIGLHEALQAENNRLRAENANLLVYARRYWAIRELLSDPPVLA